VVINFAEKTEPRDASGMLERIRKAIRSNSTTLLLLDEVDKHPAGHALHESLLPLLDDDQSTRVPKAWRNVVLVAAASRDEEKLNESDASNHRDFYTRLGEPLVVPALGDRPLDAAHVCASRLRNRGARHVSLAGLCCVANARFKNMRLVSAIADNAVIKDGKVEAAQFVRRGLRIPKDVTPDSDVILPPMS
jgi:hypothetical protein